VQRGPRQRGPSAQVPVRPPLQLLLCWPIQMKRAQLPLGLVLYNIIIFILYMQFNAIILAQVEQWNRWNEVFILSLKQTKIYYISLYFLLFFISFKFIVPLVPLFHLGLEALIYKGF
jgi:hypothetical protein